MSLRVSTTGINVVLNDLGITVVHPTIDRDLSLEFTAVELRDSIELTAAIQNSDLTVDDGTHVIDQNDYNADEFLLQQLGIKPDRLYISHDELESKGDIFLVSGVFPLSLNSTASVTRNVYTPSARWITWQLDVNDIVAIDGSTAADGTYTVESITDQQNFIVIESVSDSTGGNINVYHPNAPTRIGTDDSNFTLISGVNLQSVLESIDDRLGTGGFADELVKISSNDTTAGYLIDKFTTTSGILINELNDGGNEQLEFSFDYAPHRVLDQLVHNIAEDAYTEYTYIGTQVTNATVWTDSGKTTKIRESQYTYSGVKIITATHIQYNLVGNEVERLTKTYTYIGNTVANVDEVLT